MAGGKGLSEQEGARWEREAGEGEEEEEEEEEKETYQQRPLGLENSHPDGCSLAVEPDINERPAEPDKYASTSYFHHVLYYIFNDHSHW